MLALSVFLNWIPVQAYYLPNIWSVICLAILLLQPPWWFMRRQGGSVATFLSNKDVKISTSLGGLEPPTFRLTAERASRLRHRDVVAHNRGDTSAGYFIRSMILF